MYVVRLSTAGIGNQLVDSILRVVAAISGRGWAGLKDASLSIHQVSLGFL